MVDDNDNPRGVARKMLFECDQCSSPFWKPHLVEHQRELNEQSKKILESHDVFRKKLSKQVEQPHQHQLLEQINQWECESIFKIHQRAYDLRQLLHQCSEKKIHDIRMESNQLTEQLHRSREERHLIEADLHRWRHELKILEEELSKPAMISLVSTSRSLIHDWDIEVSASPWNTADIGLERSWTQNGVTIAGGNGPGSGAHQLSQPVSCYVDDHDTIYVVDYLNHRIIQCHNHNNTVQLFAGGRGAGNRDDQLSAPVHVTFDRTNNCFLICDHRNRRVVRWPCQAGKQGETMISSIDCWGLVIDKYGSLYVSDTRRHEVRRWRMGEDVGTVVAGCPNEQDRLGNRLDQLSYPTYIFVDDEESVYVSDSDNHRVVKWMKNTIQGIIVAGGQGQGDGLEQLLNPRGIIVDAVGTLYVADCSNNRIMRFAKGSRQGSVVVGGNGPGDATNQLNSPSGISFDPRGNLYVVDSNNHRIQRFDIDRNTTA